MHAIEPEKARYRNPNLSFGRETASLWCWFLTGILGLAVAGCQRPVPGPGFRVATSTSYLEAAAGDLMETEFATLRLAEPGSCPGHFDIRPSQAAELRQCCALLRFDFQNSLDGVLEGEGTNHLQIIGVSAGAGLCKPDTYLAICRQVAEGLVQGEWLARTNAGTRMQALAERMQALAKECTNRVARAGLTGVPVIASAHQKEFCEWLGLKVESSFRAADTASIAEIDEAIRKGQLAGVKFVIANLPEGRRTADALAQRLGAKVVVFENFPALSNGRVSFDAMVRRNIEGLLGAPGR